MQPDFDDYDEFEHSGFNWMLVTVLLLAIAGFFSLAWYAYQTGTQPMESDDVIVIQADRSPIKVEPEDPGGAEFPHQEKTIYEAVQAERNGATQVRVIEQTEEPDWEAIATMAEAEEPKPALAADEKIAEIIQQAVQDTQEEIKQEKRTEPKPLITADPFAPTSKPEPVVVSSAGQEVAVAGVRVQLGAFRDRVEAAKQWQKILGANRDVLGNKPYQIVKADLGAKGVFYRLRVAGFNTEEQAKAVCKTLSTRRQGCFMVR